MQFLTKVESRPDWGSWYWPGVIIDLGGTRDRVHRGDSPWLPFELSSGSNSPHDDEERDESVERITRIIDALERRTSNFVMPEYHSFKLAWKPVRGPDFPGGEKYADPRAGSNCFCMVIMDKKHTK